MISPGLYHLSSASCCRKRLNLPPPGPEMEDMDELEGTNIGLLVANTESADFIKGELILPLLALANLMA